MGSATRGGSGLGTIVNDDTDNISISDRTLAEGTTAGTTAFIFTVTLSNAADQTITVDFTTTDGTALDDSDYAAQADTLTFAPGETSKQITVLVNKDSLVESDETFTVDLANPTFAGSEDLTRAAILDGSGLGTIVNDDTANISISDRTLAEGTTAGTTAFIFTVTLSNSADQTITVDFTTTVGTALHASDYTPYPTRRSSDLGETSKQITVLVNKDSLVESDETFTVD